MESLFGSLRGELVHRTGLPTREAARRAIFEHLEAFHDHRCRHSGLGFLDSSALSVQFTPGEIRARP